VAMENCSDDDGACGEAAWPRIVAQGLVNCGDDDGAGGEAAQPRIVARKDGELWAKEDTFCSAAIVIVISRNWNNHGYLLNTLVVFSFYNSC
jgi:hypothetical protein